MTGPRRRSFRLLVVGNGATAVDRNGVCYINRHTCQFLIDLAERGYAVSSLEIQEDFDLDSNLYDRAIPTGLIRVVRFRWNAPLTKLRSVAASVLALLRADFVHLFYPGTLSRRIAGLCRSLRKPYGIYLRGERFGGEHGDDKVFRGARFVISVSNTLAAPLTRLNDDVMVIRPMLDISAADAERRQPGAARQGPFRILFVGRLEGPKGIPELIEAARMLEARELDFTLTLVGGGPFHAGLFQQFGDGPEGRVRVVGAVADPDRLTRYFEEADLLVLPTHHEGFPRVLYEAMIKSTTIVTTMVGGIPGLMRHEENCLAVPIGDAPAIADAVERLAGDPALLERLAEKGLATVLDVLANRPSHLEAVMSRLDG